MQFSNSKIIHILIFVVLINYCCYNGSVVLPVKLKTSIEPINSHSLICHSSLSTYNLDQINPILLDSIDPGEELNTVRGYLCSQIVTELTCFENFFGIESQTYNRTLMKPKFSDCIEAIQEWKDDRDKISEQLLPNCGWLKTNQVSSTEFHIHEKSFLFDGYNMEVQDSLLLGGKCGDQICETVYPNILWFAENQFTNNCPKLKYHAVKLYKVLNSFNKSDFIFKSHYIPEIGLSKACTNFNFCGNRGLVLEGGYFVSLTQDLVNYLLEEHIYLKDCSSDTLIKSLNLPEQINNLELNIDELFFLDKCKKTLSMINYNQNLSFYDIAYLNPRKEGIFYGYILTSTNKLKQALMEYRDLTNVVISCNTCMTCYLSGKNHGKLVRVDKSLIRQGEIKETCLLPNGFLIVNDTIIDPVQNLNQELEYLLEQSQISGHFLHHPVPKVNKLILEPSLVKVKESNAANFINTISSNISDFSLGIKFYIKTTIQIIIILIILYVIFKLKLIQRCFKLIKQKKKEKSKFDIELKEMTSKSNPMEVKSVSYNPRNKSILKSKNTRLKKLAKTKQSLNKKRSRSNIAESDYAETSFDGIGFNWIP